MKLNLQINHMPCEAQFNDDDIKDIFMPLIEKLKDLQKEKGDRLLVMMSAPPGSGKTTLCKLLSYLSDGCICPIGMDGFHHYMSYIYEHTVIRDGKEVPMINVKGCPDSFDLPKLTQYVKEVSAGVRSTWPDYDRMKKDPIEEAVKIDGDIVLLEGNYLLLNKPGWDILPAYADTTIKLTAEPEFLRERIIKRKHATGASMEESVAFVDYSDMYNVKLCLENLKDADIELYLSPDVRYHLIKG